VATLEDAAEELANKLRELDHEVEEGEQAIHSFGEKLGAATSHVEEEWKALGERVTAFLEKVNAQAETVNGDVSEAGQALADLQNGIASDLAEADGAVDAARGEMSALEEHVRAQQEPLESMVADQVEAPLQQLAEQAEKVKESLDQAVSEAREFLEQDVADALSAMRDQISERVDQVRQGPLQECTDALQQAYDKWQTALEFVEETVVEKAYAAAPDHAQQVIEFALGECKTAYDEAEEELTSAAQVVEDALGELKQEAERRADALREDGQQELSSGHAELTQALSEAVSALDAVKRLLASFTFVQL
jgi:ElaB/YqjD/DUF883 family membrane-anchored ribosome-binding protein